MEVEGGVPSKAPTISCCPVQRGFVAPVDVLVIGITFRILQHLLHLLIISRCYDLMQLCHFSGVAQQRILNSKWRSLHLSTRKGIVPPAGQTRGNTAHLKRVKRLKWRQTLLSDLQYRTAYIKTCEIGRKFIGLDIFTCGERFNLCAAYQCANIFVTYCCEKVAKISSFLSFYTFGFMMDQ